LQPFVACQVFVEFTVGFFRFLETAELFHRPFHIENITVQAQVCSTIFNRLFINDSRAR
jgi:hypothetical protein